MMKTFPKLNLLLIVVLITAKGFSQCREEQQNLDSLQKEYNVLFVDLEKQSEELRKALPDSTKAPSVPGHHISFDVTMKKQKISFDLLDITMKSKTMSISLPQVTMKTKSFSIATVKTGWKVTNVGFGIKTKTLVVTKGSKKISFKIPEMKMNRTDIVTKIPEFKKRRKEIVIDIPEFKMKSPIPEENKFTELQQKSDAIAKQADTLNKAGVTLEREQKDKSKIIIGNLFSCIDKELKLQKIQTEKNFQEAIIQIDVAIDEIKSHDLKPESVKNDDGTVTNLYSVKEELTKAHDETIRNIDTALIDLKQQLEKIMDELNS